MAFNPFNWFRKHQKKLIVVVTIFVMFIFILQFGKGDAFERMATFFGARAGGRGELITTINGHKIKDDQTSKVSRQRKAASDFLIAQARENHTKALENLLQKELVKDAGAGFLDPKFQLRRVCEGVQRRERIGFMQFQFGVEAMVGALFNAVETEIPNDLQTLEGLAADKEYLKSDPKEKLAQLQKIATLVGYQQWEFSRAVVQIQQQQMGITATPDDLCFGGNSKTLEDTLDFIMWKDVADKLGIRLTDADLAAEINREAATDVFADPDKVELDKDGKVLKFLRTRDHSDVPPKELIEALREEFRVVMAQGVLLGNEPGVRFYRSLTGAAASPAAVTPDEFLNFFREQRTTLKVQMLPIPVEKYLAQVEEPRNEGELRARYDKYRDKEWLPYSRDPGFKESRRALVQYVVGDTTNPKHRALAHKEATAWGHHAEAKWRVGRVFGAAAGSPSLLGAGPLGPVVNLLAPIALDPLGVEYDRYVNDQGNWIYSNFEEERTRQVQLREETLLAPRVIGATVASASSGPLSGLSGLYAAGTLHETRRSMRQVGGTLLAGSDVSNVIAAAALALATAPDVRSFQQASPFLLVAMEEKVSRDLLRSQFETITQELKKVSKDSKKADEYVQKALKDYPALKLVTMASPQSQAVLAEKLESKRDPQLTALLTPLQKRIGAASERELAAGLFAGQGAYDAQRAKVRPRQQMRFAMEDPDPEFEAVEYLWWRKEDLPARVREFKEVRDEVVRAWKMDRARTMARQEADRLASEINKKKWSAEDAERFLRENQSKYGEAFELDSVSQLVMPPREVHAMMRSEYRRYQVPQDKKAVMPYESPELVKLLLTLERPGQATMVPDLPLRTFYVAVLVARDVPSVSQFRRDAYSRASRTDPLYTMFVQQRSSEYRRSVTEYLRREAGKVGKDGRFEIPDDVRKRENRSDDAEG